MDLFDQQDGKSDNRPLADRMRPRSLDEFVGQDHLLGADSLLRRAVAEDRLFSVIFWGPPGSGKTTLARIMAQETKSHFISFSAVLAGVKEIRGVVEEATELWRHQRRKTILFVDEIHRFNICEPINNLTKYPFQSIMFPPERRRWNRYEKNEAYGYTS